MLKCQFKCNKSLYSYLKGHGKGQKFKFEFRIGILGWVKYGPVFFIIHLLEKRHIYEKNKMENFQ